MSGFIGDLIEGIADFFTDIWVARRQRAHRGRPTRSVGEDAAKVAVLDLQILGLGLLALICGAVMTLALGLPIWISVLPAVAVVVYGVCRWLRLVRE
ncbi:hypothetical protein [Stenotrophomonas sp. PS02289]|uniref:hypothetical protein n=1 Tax=Stenotrophomonas sp. PS02289 TaxID=2991422 RepID=UPI00249BC46D|nr:hypothetical protein [Stenotrophomonas sp. PS02289]